MYFTNWKCCTVEVHAVRHRKMRVPAGLVSRQLPRGNHYFKIYVHVWIAVMMDFRSLLHENITLAKKVYSDLPHDLDCIRFQTRLPNPLPCMNSAIFLPPHRTLFHFNSRASMRDHELFPVHEGPSKLERLTRNHSTAMSSSHIFAVTLVGGILGAAGVATHVGFFHRGEHHMLGILYLQILIGIFITVSFNLVAIGEPLVQALLITTTLAGCYLSGLYGSLIICRIFFSPLKRFPGPFWAKISSLSFSIQSRKGNSHRKLLALHQKYGDFVRVGPSDVSTIHPKATSAIYGRGSRCIKAEWYDLTLPMVSMQTTRNRPEHDQRRRIWGPAFNDTMLRSYEGRIAIYQDQLITRISNLGGNPVNVSELFNLYSFDVMGDLAFGTLFNMLQNSEQHWAVKLLHKGMEPLGLVLPPWCFRLLLAIPGAAGDWFMFKDYCCQKLDELTNVGNLWK